MCKRETYWANNRLLNNYMGGGEFVHYQIVTIA